MKNNNLKQEINPGLELKQEARGFIPVLKKLILYIYPLILLLLLWESASRFHFVNSILLPPPSRIISHTLRYWGASGDWLLWRDAAMSFYRLFIGCVLAIVVGIPLGMSMGIVGRINRFFTPILSILLPIPSLAWVPIVILWLGIGNSTPIFIVFLSGIFSIVYNTSIGARSVDHKLIWAAQTMGASKFQVFMDVILPGSLSYIITGTKLAIGGGWRSLVAAEMLSATMFGLGYRIFQAKGFMQIEMMYAGIIWLALLGFLLENCAFRPLESKTIKRWGSLREL